MRIFVTGGSGYIGRAVVAELRRRGHHVAALARSDKAAATVRSLGAQAVHGSLDALDVIELATREHDATIHLAAPTPPDGVAREAKLLDVLLRVAPNDHTIVYTSGAWVYGDRGDAVVDEDAPVAPIALVAWRPAHEERVLAARSRGIRGVVIRPTVVYGDGGGIVGMLVAQANPGPLKIVGNGANRWSTVRVDALAELYAAAVEQPAANGVYNAINGAPVPYVEIARAASRAAGGNGGIEHLTFENAKAAMGAFAEALALDLQVTSDKAHRELGWNPHRPTVLEELANTVVP
ncbi:MAG TPA: NAD-dependent epimerase/dehydratase family protein [Candidatus Lustribacter sp.]|nr:NAD-dependent epimerase/dehydratase family protein [Candidatus Lustribacter sp.]